MTVRSARACLFLAIIFAHAVLFYELTHAPARATSDGPPMFGPAIANRPVAEQARPLRSRPWIPPAVEKSTVRVGLWHFPRVDIWPLAGESCPTPSEFGPLMGTQPVAVGASAPAKHPPPRSIPATQSPRMVRWLRPAYPLEWAKTEMEGTVQLGFRILPSGETDEIAIESSAGSQKLDHSAAEAAKSWRFAPERWKGQPVESKATVALTFRFFEFSASRIDEDSITTASSRGLHRAALVERSDTVRRIVEQLRTGTTNVFLTSANADVKPSWPISMREWGPISNIEYLGAIGSPEWSRYKVKLKYRSAAPSDFVVVRWELYRVVHGDHAALWEAGLDRAGAVWALKAETLESVEQANKPPAVCLGACPGN